MTTKLSRVSLLLITLILAGCFTTSPNNSPIASVASLKENYPLIVAEAQKWKGDAYLYEVILEFEGRNQRIEADFRSPAADISEALAVTIDPQTKSIHAETFAPGKSIQYDPVILETGWKLDSVEVMKKFSSFEAVRALTSRLINLCGDLKLKHFFAPSPSSPSQGKWVLAWSLSIFECLSGNSNYFYLDPLTGKRIDLGQ